MFIKYILEIRAVNAKYLNIGVLTVLSFLKKQEQFKISNISIKKRKNKKKKHTVLKGPHVNKLARDQYEVEEVSVALEFIFYLVGSHVFFVPKFFEAKLSNYLNPQYLEIKIKKEIRKS
jgi:hypothetical protein